MFQRASLRSLGLAAGFLALLPFAGCSDHTSDKPAAEPSIPARAPAPPAASPNAAESAPSGEATGQLDRSPLGVFEGVLPCSDCDGIQTELTLYLEPDTFQLTETYLGGGAGGKVVASEGKWTTQQGSTSDPDATIVKLGPDKPDEARSFLEVGSDRLEQLDRNQHRIASKGNQSLTRKADDEEGR